MLSSEYGWTTKEILSLTSREITWRVKSIHERKQLQVELDAALHGIPMKSSVQKEEVKLDEKQEANLDKVIKERMKNGR